MRIRPECDRNGSTPYYARFDWDVKAVRVARQLRIFLEKIPRDRSRDRRHRSEISFDEILSPAVCFALARLRQTAPAAKNILAESAWDDLHRDLSARLAFALTPTLRLHQAATEAVACSLSVGHNGHRQNPVRMSVTLLETIKEFPDLLATAAQVISAWTDAQRELFTRLLRDRADLCSGFLRTRKRARVLHIRPGMSDPHDGGRTATLIQFVGNARTIYKPRSSDGERFWFEALRWLNRNGIGASFRTPKMISRKNYFWMEFLRAKSCKSSGEVRLFYFRWGVQVALAQILGAADLHRENWLAIGSQPILVDVELIGGGDSASLRPKRNSQKRPSLPAILQTGLLPLIAGDRAGLYRGIAPLDATISASPSPSCWPRHRGHARTPSRYVSDLIRGFEAVARLFRAPEMAQRFFKEVVLRGPSREQRVLLRPTAHYARLLRESWQAHNMISAGERWRRLFRECHTSASTRRLAQVEARDLFRCDIPKFTRRKNAVPASWKVFSAAIAGLNSSSRLLRSRVLLGTRRR